MNSPLWTWCAYSAPVVMALLGFSAGRSTAEVSTKAVAPTPYRNGYPIEVIRVIDGDTFVGRATLPWGESSREITFRAADFDAWEASKRRRSVNVTDEEVEKGRAAKDWLVELAAKKRMRAVPLSEGASQDKYGRSLAMWYVAERGSWVPVASLAAEAGHIRSN